MRSNTDVLENQNLSHSEPILEASGEKENLINSASEILHSIASKLENKPEERASFVSRMLHHFSLEKWQPWKFTRQVLSHTVVNKNTEKNGLVLDNTLGEILSQIYIKISNLASQKDSKKINEEELISICNIIADLYSLQPESHSLNPNNTDVYQAFWEL